MANTQIELTELHQAIETAIHQQFPSFKLVEFYRGDDLEDRESRQLLHNRHLPACLLELSEFEPCSEEDSGTGQLPVRARFEARFLINAATAQAQLGIRRLACAFATWLYQQRWFHGLPTGPVELVSILPDDFSPSVEQYAIWKVEWTQLLYLGESAWVDEGITPQSPLYSVAPEIGLQHKKQYQTIED